MRILILYDNDHLEGRDPEMGPERRAMDEIDGDKQDAFVVWRSVVGEGPDAREVVRCASTGIYETIDREAATAFVNSIENAL